MLTRTIRIQLVLFTVLSLVALVVLGWYYLRVPSLVGIGQYRLTVELPASGGLYSTANVTYRGSTIGKVIDIEPTQDGVRATVSIDDRYKIPADASANVHSVSAVGEQYLDLVSTGDRGHYLAGGQTITNTTVPSEIGPTLDSLNRLLAVLPKDKIAGLLDETSQAIGGLGPSLQRLVNSTQAVVGDLDTHIEDVNDVVANSPTILDSQVNSAENIARWAANLNVLAAQSAERDKALQNVLTEAAPTADGVNAVFGAVHEALPQTLANLEIVLDMLKRYNAGVEQLLVILPQGTAISQTVTASIPGLSALDFSLALNQPPPCLTGFLPASQWRAPADTSTAPLPENTYCKIPKDTPSNVVRGSRNLPCVDVPGKRAATPQECRSNEPYVPAGTNPWYGDPNQVLTCSAPAARCDQPVKPGLVIPAPSVNSGMNPLPADQLPGPPPPSSNQLSPPRAGSVECSGQQPNPCKYIPGSGPTATYNPSSGEVIGPNGVRYSIENSGGIGDDGWKQMLSPAATP